MNPIKKFFRKINVLRLHRLTLDNLEKKMGEEEFHINLKNDLLKLFKKKIENEGEDEFKLWLYNLNFSIPEEFKDEIAASQLYDKYSGWFDKQIKKLEDQYGIPFEEQASDIQDINIKAQKAQLVIRDRLTMIVLDLY